MDREKRHRIHPKTLSKARSLRRPLTPAEKKLWARIRGGQVVGLKFRRQHQIGPFIADFCCPAAGLVVEIDGDTHAGQESHDAARTEQITALGYRVIRFTNSDVHSRLKFVLDEILVRCEALLPSPRPSP
jgi:very-short-patch-repair endonuclease